MGATGRLRKMISPDAVARAFLARQGIIEHVPQGLKRQKPARAATSYRAARRNDSALPWSGVKAHIVGYHPKDSKSYPYNSEKRGWPSAS